MNNQSTSDRLSVVAALLLILTAWGNAAVMLIVSILGLAAMLYSFRKKKSQGGYSATTVGFALAIGISLMMFFR